MPGTTYVNVPDDGEDLTLKIRGEELRLQPSAGDLLRFQSAVQHLTDLEDLDQYATLVDALLEHLTAPHTDLIRGLSVKQQTFICNELWAWYTKLIPQEDADPTSEPFVSPATPTSGSVMSSNGHPGSSSVSSEAPSESETRMTSESLAP